MTKSTNTIRTNTKTHRDAPNSKPTLCVALRLWGFDESEVQSWMNVMPDLDGSIAWKISRVRLETDADVVVHMVKPARRAKDLDCWHCIQVNRVVSHTLATGGTAITLFMGNADELPRRRAGRWSVAGTLSAQAALGLLGRLIAASSARQKGGRATVRLDLLGMIAQQLDAG
ncbi:hypothetical protein [Paraburkholderia terrae]|uniref:hypothetical protein n=1 Tax=Paraburkholderia terrae TaxID=311230 RepID=UPI001EE316F9|nr:hypothetical protein [Paraburkholderia terrae]GJH02743.1 hypothetical protein CBA19C8_19320 [Paraburkholderia terrae]